MSRTAAGGRPRRRRPATVPSCSTQPDEQGGAEAVGVVAAAARRWRCARTAAGSGAVDGGGPDRVASERGDDGGLRALAADVAEDGEPVVVGELEHVVEVAADLVAVAGGPVRGRDVEPGDARRRRRDQRLLERLREGDRLRLAGLGALLRAEQLALVLAPLGGVEDRGPHHDRRAGGVALERPR